MRGRKKKRRWEREFVREKGEGGKGRGLNENCERERKGEEIKLRKMEGGRRKIEAVGGEYVLRKGNMYSLSPSLSLLPSLPPPLSLPPSTFLLKSNQVND